MERITNAFFVVPLGKIEIVILPEADPVPVFMHAASAGSGFVAPAVPE